MHLRKYKDLKLNYQLRACYFLLGVCDFVTCEPFWGIFGPNRVYQVDNDKGNMSDKIKEKIQ